MLGVIAVIILGIIALIIDIFVLFYVVIQPKLYKDKQKLKEMELKRNEKDN